MRILYLSQQFPFPPHLNGFTVRAYNVLRGISQRHDVDLLAFTNRPVESDAIRELERACRTVRVVSVDARHARPGDRISSILPAEVRPYMRAASEAGLSGAYDLIHAEGAYMAPVARLRPDLPALVSPSDALSLLEWQLISRTSWPTRGSRFVRWLKTMALERLYSSFAGTVVVTDKDANHLSRITSGRLHVIPNGVDTEYFEPRRDPVLPPELLFTGVLSYPPNVDAACFFAQEIMPLVRANHPDAVFLVVGRDPAPRLRSIHDSAAGVKVVGEVPDLRPYMNRASLYVSPLRLGAGIKNKVLEALSMSMPVVATQTSLDGIDVRLGTHCLGAERPAEFATIVSQLLRSPTNAEAFGKAGRSLVVEKYGWGAAVNAYLSLYEAISKGR